MSKMTSRMVVPMGTSIRPVLTTLPVRAKAFVPGLFSVPMPRYQPEPVADDEPGTLAKVSTLLRTVGLAQRPCSTVRGGLTRGMPRLPSMEAVRALPSPQTNAPAPRLTWMPEGKAAAQDMLAQKAQLLGLCDGGLQAADGQGILRADVDVALVGPGGHARDHHALQHAVGVALHDGAVHEGAGVALVAVADHVLRARHSGGATLVPLPARRGSRRRPGPGGRR